MALKHKHKTKDEAPVDLPSLTPPKSDSGKENVKKM
jgi:hypothetical protein